MIMVLPNLDRVFLIRRRLIDTHAFITILILIFQIEHFHDLLHIDVCTRTRIVIHVLVDCTECRSLIPQQ
jgi:hypothetical protein